jgi:hypothetical protein
MSSTYLVSVGALPSRQLLAGIEQTDARTCYIICHMSHAT